MTSHLGYCRYDAMSASGWNSLTRTINTTSGRRVRRVDEKLTDHLEPPGWEQINLSGDYVWRVAK